MSNDGGEVAFSVHRILFLFYFFNLPEDLGIKD